MKHYKTDNLNILLEKKPSTPRFCVSFLFRTDKKEKYYGINSLLARLLLQGTKTKDAKTLADEFENECIDITSKAKQDYIKISLVFMNCDFDLALKLAKDILLNSTMNDFEKEVFKMKGEIISDLDNPKMKLTDAFVKNIFKSHPYSSTHTKILDDLDKITKQDILDAHKQMLNSFGAICVVGDYQNDEEMVNYFKNNFDFLNLTNNIESEIENIHSLNENEIIKVEKDDVSQAQIIQGWLVDSFDSSNCAKYALLNNILGASGLSSRLFVNLRDKQGLAYNVRSQYETFLHSAIFNMYIGTTPKNIKKSLSGFESELKKLVDVLVEDEELTGAKENIQGRLKYFSQNNSQINASLSYNFLMGLGLDYNERFIEEIKKVSAKDVQDMAKKLLESKKLISIIARKEDFIGL